MPGPFLNQRPQDVVARQRFKSRLEKDFKTNQCHSFAITKDEFACLWIETQKSYGKTEAQIKEALSSLTGLSVANIVLSFTANYGSAIKDIPAFLALANDFRRSGNILGKYDITIRNGREYIVFKGDPRLRKIIQRTRYLLTNTKIINIGIGKEGIRSNGTGGFYIGLLVSVTLDTINWIFKDNYRWTNWLGTISTDIVKAVIGYAAYVLTAAIVGVFSVAIVASISGIAIGLYLGYKLTEMDDRYHVTESIINALNYAEKYAEKNAPLLADSIYKVHLNAARDVVDFFEIDISKINFLYNKAVAQW